MREPVLTPEQAAAARRAAMLGWEKDHAAAAERKAMMLQVSISKHTRVPSFSLSASVMTSHRMLHLCLAGVCQATETNARPRHER